MSQLQLLNLDITLTKILYNTYQKFKVYLMYTTNAGATIFLIHSVPILRTRIFFYSYQTLPSLFLLALLIPKTSTCAECITIVWCLSKTIHPYLKMRLAYIVRLLFTCYTTPYLLLVVYEAVFVHLFFISILLYTNFSSIHKDQ